MEHCPKCRGSRGSGGCLERRRVRNGHTDQDFYYYYWRHNPVVVDGKKKRPSCYIGKALRDRDSETGQFLPVVPSEGTAVGKLLLTTSGGRKR